MTVFITNFINTSELIERAKGLPHAEIQRALGERLDQIYRDSRPISRLLDDEDLCPYDAVELIQAVLGEGIRNARSLALRLREPERRDVQVDSPEFT